MEKPRRSRSRAWSVSPAVLALAVGLAGWGAAALAEPGKVGEGTGVPSSSSYSNYDRDPGDIDLRDKSDGIGGLEPRGKTRSVDLPGGAEGNRPANTSVKGQKTAANQPSAGILPGDYGGSGKRRTAGPAQDGRDIPGKKHNYKGVVTLVRGTAPRPGDGKPDGSPRVMDEANSAMGQVSTTRGRLERPDQALQPGIAVFTLPPTYLPDAPFQAALRPNAGDKTLPGPVSNDRAPPPDAASGGKGEARTFKVTVQPVNDPPSKVATGIPPSVDPGGAPVTVQLRNVDTGALARTIPNPANGELAFTGLPAANYVVEIVDAAGKVVGTSPSQHVAAGGTLSGRLGQSGRVGDSFFDVFITGAPIGQNAAADKPVRTAAAGDVAASPVGGFGKGMPGSPGFGPDVGRMNGPGPGMMSPPGPGAPAMSGPMGMGGRVGPMMGGAMGRP